VLHASDGAADMHRDRVVEPLQVERRDPTRCAAVTGSVEETVESAVTLDGECHQRFDVSFDCHVGAHERRFPTERPGQRLALLSAASGDDDPGSLRAE
jgi:hypothetical protein